MSVSQYPQFLVSVPAVMWNKCSVCAVTCEEREDSIARNLVGNSWHKWDATMFNWIFCHGRVLIYCLGLGLGLLFVMMIWWKLCRRRNRLVNDHYN